jgi:hypothetical protein
MVEEVYVLRTAVIDQFEQEYAVIEWIDTKETKDIPKHELPVGAKVNDVLIWNKEMWHIDTKATKERQEKMDRLMSELWEEK